MQSNLDSIENLFDENLFIFGLYFLLKMCPNSLFWNYAWFQEVPIIHAIIVRECARNKDIIIAIIIIITMLIIISDMDVYILL